MEIKKEVPPGTSFFDACLFQGFDSAADKAVIFLQSLHGSIFLNIHRAHNDGGFGVLILDGQLPFAALKAGTGHNQTQELVFLSAAR